MERWVHVSYSLDKDHNPIHGASSGPFTYTDDASKFAASQEKAVCVRITMWDKIPDDWITKQDTQKYAILHGNAEGIFALHCVPYTTVLIDKKTLLETYAELCGATVEEMWEGFPPQSFKAWIINGITKKHLDAMCIESGNDGAFSALAEAQFAMVKEMALETRHFK